ncbi:sulfatase-like hydrolase/transferase [Rubellicoccus peritrichatus]|uniref:Sulfatase-like hydrolase/transferase n=1 Tax=Rubellicoccus peritrichatus TaxID=3080537 RepID=A0AAQ3QUN1_9BACT|nr:sulfatase-like hydrolase/transferase [Puniceicoccus sp. CR14]WOO39932.1 sulfatase-like hydrolase/transferase [Puniceicoccus sp. CR14]
MPPNILILMTDQQRPDAAGFLGNSVVRTPTLDALARDAVVFDNAYTPSPVCVPARPCIAAGKLPQTAGCLSYGDDIPAGSMTFPRVFSQHAYHTVVCGKLHHEGPDQYQGWNLRVGLDNAIGAPYVSGLINEEQKKYPPRDDWWPWKKEVQMAGPGRSLYLFRDEMAVDGACHILEQHFTPTYSSPHANKPLMLKVSLTLPHYPYLTDEKLFQYYYDRVSLFVDEQPSPHPRLSVDALPTGTELSIEEVRRATAAYYGMTEKADQLFARVVNQLKQVGQDIDDWIVVFMSDHGEMLGEHAVWMKYKFYESSVRVPFFIRWPKHFHPSHVSQNVNLCDLFSTLCDLAGFDCPQDLDSRSLEPLLEGKYENWINETISQLDDAVMIKQDSLKYIFFGDGSDEVLFDLSRDPSENRDFAKEPEYQEAIKAFRRRLSQLGYNPIVESFNGAT